jgi:hypothetical protein
MLPMLRLRDLLAKRSLKLAGQNRESGQSIVEVIVAMGLFILLMVPTVAVVGTLTNTAGTTTKVSNSTLSIGLAVQLLESYMTNAVSPNVANSASLGTGTPTACWGTKQPNSTSGGTETGGQLVDASNNSTAALSSVIISHDYDFEFCGYHPGSNTAHVYRIWLTKTPKSGKPCNASICTVEVDDYGTTAANTYTTTSFTAVLDIPNVPCDTYCQGQGAPTSSTATDNSLACIDQGLPAGTCSSSATPPLFTYYGSGGSSAGALNPTALPLADIYCDDTNGIPSGCSAATTGTSNTDILSEVSSVGLDFSILGTISPGNAAKTTETNQTNVDDQVDLINLSNPASAPGAVTITGVTGGGAGSGTATINWTVGFDGGATIQSFTIIPFVGSTEQTSLVETVAAGGAGLSAATGSADSYQILLTTGKTYTFTVQATNEIGTSPSASSSVLGSAGQVSV